jgi:hypothetical protein
MVSKISSFGTRWMDAYITAIYELVCEGIAKQRIANEEIPQRVAGKHTCWQAAEVENRRVCAD